MMPRVTCLEVPRTGTESRHHNAQSFKWVLDHIGFLFFDLLIHLPGPPEKHKDLVVSYLYYPGPEKRISSYITRQKVCMQVGNQSMINFFSSAERGLKTFSGVHRF